MYKFPSNYLEEECNKNSQSASEISFTITICEESEVEENDLVDNTGKYFKVSFLQFIAINKKIVLILTISFIPNYHN